ncbi:MAG: preprotein translocase subunit YajC [Candidatus Hinthialibacter antarcticus]|nr:preprotein translocase subunit YajC [Candidatus Hinthialibacter antarcticus]
MGTEQAGGMTSIMQMLMPLSICFFIFYFLLIRPQQKQREKHEQKINQLKKGDRLITAGGIYATLIGIKGDVAAIKINEDTKIEIQKSSITHIIEKSDKDNA